MTVSVRLYAHIGMIALPVASYSGQQSFHANFALKQPYIAKETIAVTTAVSSGAALSDSVNAKILRIEVEASKRVHYEVNPPGRTGGAVAASADSPILYGEDQIEWGKDWVLSLMEAS